MRKKKAKTEDQIINQLIPAESKETAKITIETVNLEDVRAVLQTYKGATIYPITIGNIIKDIRKKTLEQKNQGIWI